MSTPPPNISDFQDKVNAAFGSKKKKAPTGDQAEDVKSSAATQAVEFVHGAGVTLWHTAEREAFLTRKNEEGVVSHLPVQSTECAEWMSLLFYKQTQKAISSDAVKAAQNLLAAQAKFEGAKRRVFNRIAHWSDGIYVDLGDEQWRAVHIADAGWSIVESDKVPVAFRRSRTAKALPTPEHGGNLDALRIIFPNVEDAEWILIAGFLVGCFQQEGARAFLELAGGQGSGKTTFARYLASLIDPSEVPTRSMPKDESSLLIATIGKLILSFDNLSTIAPEMADALCRISTGAGLGARSLYTNSEESLLKAQLSLIWTCIEQQALRRPDLQDRTISILLRQLEETTYQSERDIEEAFTDIYPQLLGALYTAVSVALRNRTTVHLERLPRLADFCLWVEASAPAFGWDVGAFTDILEASRAVASAMAVDASPVGTLIVEFMKTHDHWEGPAGDLLAALKDLADDDAKRNRSFPKDATRLSGQLRRLQRPLAALGLYVGFNRSKKSRDVILDRAEIITPPPEPKQESPYTDEYWAARNAEYGQAYHAGEKESA